MLVCFLMLLAPPAPATVDGKPLPEWFGRAVTELSATCEPAEAKPGQTVTLKLKLKLTPGHTTYPTKQPEKAAAGMVSQIPFPVTGDAIFVGKLADPEGFSAKAEPELGIKELRTYAGEVVWSRSFVVSPKAKPGELAVAVSGVKFTVCDANNCYPPKALVVKAKLTVLAGPAVAVEPAYAAEVAKALEGK